MTTDERSDFSYLLRWWVVLIAALLLIGGIATIADRAFSLFWFPWDMQMRTGMIRNSNSYVTTQQTALRQFMLSYENARTDGQRNADIEQMREEADLIPGYVPPDIAAFLASHGAH